MYSEPNCLAKKEKNIFCAAVDLRDAFHIIDIVFSCVSIFQLISSLPTYPPREHNLTYTYPYLFHSRCYSLYVSYFWCWVRRMPLDTSASEARKHNINFRRTSVEGHVPDPTPKIAHIQRITSGME